MTWLLNLLAGWKARLAVVGVAGILALIAKAYLAGKAAVRTKETKRRLQAMQDRKEVEDDVEAMGHADLDERFSEYMRDDR